MKLERNTFLDLRYTIVCFVFWMGLLEGQGTAIIIKNVVLLSGICKFVFRENSAV